MVVGDKIDEAVREFKRLWLEASRQKLQQVCAMRDPWIRRMLSETLPGDWQAEVDDFVDEVRDPLGARHGYPKRTSAQSGDPKFRRSPSANR